MTNESVLCVNVCVYVILLSGLQTEQKKEHLFNQKKGKNHHHHHHQNDTIQHKTLTMDNGQE